MGMKVSQSPATWVDDPRTLQDWLKDASGHELVAFDTEFIRETSFYPQIALMQIATDERVALIDPLAFNETQLEPLFALLEDPKTLKVMHAAYGDQECLHWCYGCQATPVLDTGVSAALCGFGDNIGLAKLLKETLGVHVSKGRARAKWLTRPLPKELFDYAGEDVRHLVQLGHWLIERLNKRKRLDWAISESRIEISKFDPPVDEVAERLGKSGHYSVSQYENLVELVRWRENQAKRANLPRGWVAENEVLVTLAKASPKSVEELRQFRGIHSGVVAKQGRELIEILNSVRARGQLKDNRPARSPVSLKDEQAVHFLQTFLNFLSSRHEVSSRFLVRPQLLPHLVHRGEDPDSWVKRGIVSEYAFGLVGNDIYEFLQGKTTLALVHGKVEKVLVSPE